MPSNDSLIAWPAANGQPPSANYATLDVRNGHVVLDFDDSTGESIDFAGTMPNSFDEIHGLVAVLTWAATSATSGDVRWSVAVERQQPDTSFDLDADGFSTAVSADDTAADAAGKLIATTVDLTSLSTASIPHAAEPFRLRVTRDAAHANDTMTGDAELLAVELREA